MFDIGTKELAETALAKSDLPLGPLNLHLSYNSGIAFGLGDTGPSWVVIASTTALTLALGVFAWSSTKQSARRNATALGLILGGAAANLVDRVGDSRVTDYIDFGWWPSFNFADVSIVAGAIATAALVNRRHKSTSTFDDHS
jgi:signal peptidase II